MTVVLSPATVPDGSIIAVLHDVHIPYHDDEALKLAVECFERVGVTHVVLLGDIADCGVASRHPGKKAKDTIALGTLADSVDSGRWLYQWARTRAPHCWLKRGNHERWVEDLIATDPSLSAVTVEGLLGLPDIGWHVLNSNEQLRIDSLVLAHGHEIFPSGAGGSNPGNRIQKLAPNQWTLIGHLHRRFQTLWTLENSKGEPRTYGAFGGGHMSVEAFHADYAGGYPNWQQSFEIIRVWYVDGRPRFTMYQPEIFRTRRGRPTFEFEGHVYGSGRS